MCGRLVNLDTVARVLAEYYHLKTDTQLAALDEALSKVPAVSVGGGHEKDHVADPGKMVGDLISRQAAIDALLGITAMRNTIPLDSAIFNIKKLPSAQPERKTGKWIPVTERLPEKKQEVIVTVTRKNGSIFTERDGWTGTGFWGYGHRVIAWMPLPEPYREEGENQ